MARIAGPKLRVDEGAADPEEDLPRPAPLPGRVAPVVLVQRGADIHFGDDGTLWSAIWQASYGYGNTLPMVYFLAEQGSRPRGLRHSAEAGSLKVAKIVTELGADVNEVDDDGHTLVRGERTAVCEKTFGLLAGEPYADQVFPVLPRVPVSPGAMQPFDCRGAQRRHPRESKGTGYTETTAPAPDACGDGDCC